MERLGPQLEPEQNTDGLPVVMRVGAIVGAGVVAALVSSVPGALRMGDDSSASRALLQLVVLSALATPVAVLLVTVLRRARVGVRILMGDKPQLLAIGVLWWCVIELGILSIVGAVLRKTTHHHALAGVTFAIFALVSGLLVALFARKATLLVAGRGSQERNGLVVAASSAFLVLMLVGFRTSRAEGLHTASALFDGLALTIASTLTSSRFFARYRPLAMIGVPVALLVLMVGFTMLRFDPKLRSALGDIAPIHALLIGLIGA